MDVATEIEEVVVVETTETVEELKTEERPIQPSMGDLITLPPEQVFIRSLGQSVNDFPSLRKVRFKEESDGEKASTDGFDRRRTERFHERSTRMEVGDLEASRQSRSSEKGRSRKRRHRSRSSGDMTDRQRTTESRLVKRKGGPVSTSGRQSQERPHSMTTQSSDQAKSSGKRSLKDDPRNSRCPVPGCNWYSRHMKHHAWECHIPQIFWDNPSTEIEALPPYHQLRASVLGTVASWIVGNASTIHDLVRYVNQTLAVPSQCPIMDRTRTQMGVLTRIMGWWAPRDNNYNLHPLNSPAVLIHWRVLLVLVCQMTRDQQRKFRKMGGETVKRLEREVRSKDVAAEEPVTGPLIPAGHESTDESDGEVVISGIVRSDDEGSWHGQFDDAEEGNTSKFGR